MMRSAISSPFHCLSASTVGSAPTSVPFSFRAVTRHNSDVAEIEVKMIVGGAGARAVGPRPTARECFQSDAGIPLNLFLSVEILVADAEDVCGRAPAVRRRRPGCGVR